MILKSDAEKFGDAHKNQNQTHCHSFSKPKKILSIEKNPAHGDHGDPDDIILGGQVSRVSHWQGTGPDTNGHAR